MMCISIFLLCCAVCCGRNYIGVLGHVFCFLLTLFGTQSIIRATVSTVGFGGYRSCVSESFEYLCACVHTPAVGNARQVVRQARLSRSVLGYTAVGEMTKTPSRAPCTAVSIIAAPSVEFAPFYFFCQWEEMGWELRAGKRGWGSH